MLGEVVIPGDIFDNFKTSKNSILLGPGLRRHIDNEKIIITRPGVLNFRHPNLYWVESHLNKYFPKKNELVVGVIVQKRGDIYRVDIGASETASLSSFSFEGATKKQKPDLQVGDAVYAKLLSANREMEPELICVDSYFKAGKMGPLSNENSLVFNVSIDFAHSLLKFENPLLKTLGKKTPFEICVGLNGKIWLKAKNTTDLFNIFTAIMAAEKKSLSEITQICRCK